MLMNTSLLTSLAMILSLLFCFPIPYYSWTASTSSLDCKPISIHQLHLFNPGGLTKANVTMNVHQVSHHLFIFFGWSHLGLTAW